MKLNRQRNCLSAAARASTAMQDNGGDFRASTLWPQVRVSSLPRFFLFLALALGLLASPHQAKAVMVAHPVICTTGTPGYQQSYVCDVTWIDDGDGGGGGNGSVGVGGGGGGSPHTSVNTQPD